MPLSCCVPGTLGHASSHHESKPLPCTALSCKALPVSQGCGCSFPRPIAACPARRGCGYIPCTMAPPNDCYAIISPSIFPHAPRHNMACAERARVSLAAMSLLSVSRSCKDHHTHRLLFSHWCALAPAIAVVTSPALTFTSAHMMQSQQQLTAKTTYGTKACLAPAPIPHATHRTSGDSTRHSTSLHESWGHAGGSMACIAAAVAACRRAVIAFVPAEGLIWPFTSTGCLV